MRPFGLVRSVLAIAAVMVGLAFGGQSCSGYYFVPVTVTNSHSQNEIFTHTSYGMKLNDLESAQDDWSDAAAAAEGFVDAKAAYDQAVADYTAAWGAPPPANLLLTAHELSSVTYAYGLLGGSEATASYDVSVKKAAYLTARSEYRSLIEDVRASAYDTESQRDNAIEDLDFKKANFDAAYDAFRESVNDYIDLVLRAPSIFVPYFSTVSNTDRYDDLAVILGDRATVLDNTRP